METLQPTSPIPGSPVVAVPDNIEKSYDEVPYGSHPIAASHPDKLFNVAKLYGLTPVRPKKRGSLRLVVPAVGISYRWRASFPKLNAWGSIYLKFNATTPELPRDTLTSRTSRSFKEASPTSGQNTANSTTSFATVYSRGYPILFATLSCVSLRKTFLMMG